MDWHAPDESAWQRAKETGRNVVLLLEADWCPFSRRFREQTLAAPEVLQRLAHDFIGIRVPADQNPELDRRFGGAGWPTLALADADQNPLDQTGPLRAGELVERLAAWSAGRPGVDTPQDLEMASVSEQVMQRLLASADPEYGGWGQRQKFPHPEALHFALVRWSREGDPRMLRLVTHTLQHMQAGAIHDRVEGGFFRYARTRDWGHPQFQKMLGSNAERMLAYAEAYQALGNPSFQETALGIYDWMQNTLLQPELGAYSASQDEDSEYYHLPTREQRARRKAPQTETWIYTDRNAAAVCALLKASVALDRADLADQALRTLDFLVEHLYRPGKGAYHAWDGKPSGTGLLADQAALLRAMAWAMHSTGTRKYLGCALELARHTLEAHGSGLPERVRPMDGSLVDRLHEIQARGAVGERTEALPANAQTAEALLRLSYMAEAPDLRHAAGQILSAFRHDWPRFGIATADYGRAIDLFVHEPVQVTVVGPRHGDLTRALRREALRPYIASRVVQVLDPTVDETDPECTRWPDADDEAIAYVHQAGRCYARTSDPAQLPFLMTRLGQERPA